MGRPGQSADGTPARPNRARAGRGHVASAQRVAARVGSDRADVRRLRTLGALRHVELDPLVLVQATEAASLDRREVREHVGTATVRGNESETLIRVEPLHRTDSHVFSLERPDSTHTAWAPR